MEKILIVEDDLSIRETLTDILELSGYNVIVTKNGREGYDSIMENIPDLVLCDVDMPEIDGFELLSSLNQKLKDGVVPPFIFLTAKADTQNLRQGMSLGADDYILKPFNHIYILEIIRMRLDKRKALMKPTKENSKGYSSGFVRDNKLALPCKDTLILVPFDDIIKCQVEGVYCTFHLNNGKTIAVPSEMKEFEEILITNNFFKVHESTIVNIKHAKKCIEGVESRLIMSDGSIVYVAVSNKDELMKVLRP